MFDNFISLGSWCPTAASMSKYGLRSWSSPFDWLGTPDLKSVLYFLEYDFEDFLLMENLEKYPERKTGFIDKKYNISFLHDGEYPVSSAQYDELYKKYQKKIGRFRIEIKKKNCFLRTVTENAELDYIENYADYINKIVKKENKESEIIFLLKSELVLPQKMEFPYYVMPGQHSGASWKMLRGWFDGAEEFLAYCGLNFNAVDLLKNVAFDRKKEEEIYDNAECRYQLILRLANSDFSNIPTGHHLIIYGAGNIGRYFYKQIKSKCHVEYFVDKVKRGENIDNIQVVYLDDLKYEDIESAYFVITATYDYDNIYRTIKGYFTNAKIISVEGIID